MKHLAATKEEGRIYPRITMVMPDRQEEIMDVTGECFIENAAGKTIDFIRPRKAGGCGPQPK